MRLLFAHDHRFQRGRGSAIHTLGAFPPLAWDRYLEHFDAVQVVARDGGALGEGSQLAQSNREGVSFTLLRNLSSLRQLVSRSPQADRQMSALVADSDAVVARLPSEIGLLAIKHARLQRKPYAVEVVGCPWDGYFHNGALSARLYAPLAFWRMRRAVRQAPAALYVTTDWLQRRYPTNGRVSVASNVDLVPSAAPDAARRNARLAALQSGRKPVLGTVGSLRTKAKGIQVALAAIAQLRSEGLELEYRVLGPGDIPPWVEAARNAGVDDLVHFDGARPAGQEVLDWLDDIDIHLQPSFREGLPRATIEAMSRGVACIGSSCGGIPELLPPERLHAPGDSAGLAQRIRQLAEDPGAIAAAGRADRQAAGQFERGELVRRRSAFYRQLREEAELGR